MIRVTFRWVFFAGNGKWSYTPAPGGVLVTFNLGPAQDENLISGLPQLRLQRRMKKKALQQLSLFRNPTFCIPVAALLSHFISSHSFTFVLPFVLSPMLEHETGRNRTRNGRNCAASIYRCAGERYLGRPSRYVPAQITGLAALGCGLMFLATAPSAPLHVTVAIAIASVGTSLFLSANNSMLLGAVPDLCRGTASGIIGTARSTAMAIGVALATASLTSAGRVNPDSISVPAVFRIAFGIAGVPAFACSLLLVARATAAGAEAKRARPSDLRISTCLESSL